MSRRKRQPEQFDVVDFLRESDGDLKSALNSLLRSPVGSSLDVKSGPGLDLLSRPTEAARPAKARRSDPDVNSTPDLILIPGPELSREGLIAQPTNPLPGPELTSAAAPAILIPDPKLTPGPELTTEPVSPEIEAPPPELTSDASQPRPRKKRNFPIREMKLAQDAHTRAEQQVYECLWQTARPLDEVSRTITIGFGAMARVVRLSESNARINVRSLIAKLAIEELGDYNCERSVGRTYRILNYTEILKRRREAGLVWYMRRTLAVVFVDPQTGHPLSLATNYTSRRYARPGPELSYPPGLNLIPAPPPNLGGEPGPNLGPPYREESREKELRELSSSSDSVLFQALSVYGPADDDVLRRLRAETSSICPDFTEEELLHFIHAKGNLIRRRDAEISSPIGFLLASVPKCFAGESFQFFRKNQREAREREAAERAREQADFETWRREQQAILDDPNAAEEDKQWARKVLHRDDSG